MAVDLGQAFFKPQPKPILDFRKGRMVCRNPYYELFKFLVWYINDSAKLVTTKVDKKVNDQQRGTFVPIGKAVISCKRFCKSRCFLKYAAVVTDVRSANGRCNGRHVSDARSSTERQCNVMGGYYIAQRNAIVPNRLSLREASKRVGRYRRSFAKTVLGLTSSAVFISVAGQRDMLALGGGRATHRFPDRGKLPAPTVAATDAGLRTAPISGHWAIIGPRTAIDLARSLALVVGLFEKKRLTLLLVGSTRITVPRKRDALPPRGC